MTFVQFLSALRARWLVFVLVLGTVLAATAVATLLWPKQYSASASVLVDAKPDPVSSMLYPGLGSPQFMLTQVDIFNSDRVAKRVVALLKLAENPQLRQQWMEATEGRTPIESWLAERFQASLEVKPARESNVLTITYKAADPRFAAGMANAFVRAYIDTVLEMRVNPAREYSAFFDTRLAEARDALEAAQARLSAFQRANGLIATDERFDIENSRLAELSSQVVGLQSLAAETGSRQTQAQASPERMQEVLNNPLIGGLKADLNRAEAQLEALRTRLGESHPQVIEARTNLAELRARLDSETRRVIGGVGVSNTITRSREAQVRGELEAQRAKVLRLKAVRDEGQVLARDVDNAQRAYDAVQGRLTQTSLESQTKLANVFPLTEAMPPLQPSAPRSTINMLMATLLGTMLAVAAALCLELLDRRVRDPRDLAETMGVPVLSVLPNGNRRKALAQRRGDEVRQRVLGSGGPTPATKGA
jgi:polysaccharide biosynthesis transport protein